MKIAAILLFALATTASGEEPSRVSWYWENDSFQLRNATDQHYTQGMHFRVLFDEGNVPAFVGRLPFCKMKNCSTGYSFGQSIYTPQRLIRTRPIPFDRPYGGWLYGGFLLQKRNSRSIQDFEADIGIVGPQAYAGDIQNWWHRHVVHAAPVRGWRNQLGNEPALLLQYSQRRKLYERATASGLRYADLQFRAGGAAGNVFTVVNAGPILRLGYNISDDFDRLPPSFRATLPLPNLQAVDAAPPAPNRQFEAYAFVGGTGHYVLHNIFLDGNCCRRSLSVKKRHTVGDVEVGLAVRYRMLKLTARKVHRSREFVGQEKGDIFASYNLMIDRSF